MKLIAVFAVLCWLPVASIGASCPASPPTASMVIVTSCSAVDACLNGTINFRVAPLPSGFFPPATLDPGYTIQPCDTVSWRFGDGAIDVVAGSDRATHTYSVPDNYTIEATVTNPLGSVTVKIEALPIASLPSRLTPVTKTVVVDAGVFGHTYACENCVVAMEGSGSVTVTVERSLDLSRTVGADLFVDGTSEPIPTIPRVQVPLTFAPGEVQQSVTIPIADDHLYFGPRFYRIALVNPKGGTLTFQNTFSQPTLLILDDDPKPILSIEPGTAVREGHSGLTMFRIPVHLSAPMLLDASANVFFREGTASSDDFVAGTGVTIRAGETSADLVGYIRGDTRPEPDETINIQIAPRSTNNDPQFGASNAVVTIINDDAAFVPALVSLPPLSTATLKLDIGSPYAAPVDALLTSSAPDVVPAPQPVTIPAGATTVDVVVTSRGSGLAFLGAMLPDRTTQPAKVFVTPLPRRRAVGH